MKEKTMIAIPGRGNVPIGSHPNTSTELFEMLQAGDKHWDSSVSSLFFQARHLAALAVSENSETSLVVSALLSRPCQILACGSPQAGDWTSDSLLETGTYYWLVKNFGEEIAETIRLQPYAKRFLATVIPKYFGFLNTNDQRCVFSEGGFMTVSERMAFGQHRCHHHAMKIASWIDRGVDRYMEIPRMDFFFPFLAQALVT
jgi:predicted HD phosphohydrolase